LLVLPERLTAAERAVFVLREAFGCRYADIAGILGQPEGSCRKLHQRARRLFTGRSRPGGCCPAWNQAHRASAPAARKQGPGARDPRPFLKTQAGRAAARLASLPLLRDAAQYTAAFIRNTSYAVGSLTGRIRAHLYCHGVVPSGQPRSAPSAAATSWSLLK
jgi:hypothetical protein